MLYTGYFFYLFIFFFWGGGGRSEIVFSNCYHEGNVRFMDWMSFRLLPTFSFCGGVSDGVYTKQNNQVTFKISLKQVKLAISMHYKGSFSGPCTSGTLGKTNWNQNTWAPHFQFLSWELPTVGFHKVNSPFQAF